MTETGNVKLAKFYVRNSYPSRLAVCAVEMRSVICALRTLRLLVLRCCCWQAFRLLVRTALYCILPRGRAPPSISICTSPSSHVPHLPLHIVHHPDSIRIVSPLFTSTRRRSTVPTPYPYSAVRYNRARKPHTTDIHPQSRIPNGLLPVPRRCSPIVCTCTPTACLPRRGLAVHAALRFTHMI